MATYYRWRKSTINKTLYQSDTMIGSGVIGSSMTYYYSSSYSIDNDGTITLGTGGSETLSVEDNDSWFDFYYYNVGSRSGKTIYKPVGSSMGVYGSRSGISVAKGQLGVYKSSTFPGTSQGYVYSLDSSTYPTSGIKGSYYYDQRTTIASPKAPNSITYPSSITNQAVSITFTEASSVVPDYSVNEYEISYNVNESSWVVAGTTKELSYSFNIPSVFTSNIMFRVRAKDTNGQWGDYKTGAIASVSLSPLPPPVLTLPSSPVKINESFPISWTSVSEATGYVLQKKKINDSDWSEVYNGTLLSYTDTANDLGLCYRISYKVNEFQSEWSQEYLLNTFEKLIEISYLDESGSYVPLYPVTSTVAVFNTSDLINLTLSTGTYQGNGFETNNIALENSVDPKVAIITNSKQETTLVANFNENNMTVKDSNNELGETYNYVIIGNNKSK